MPGLRLASALVRIADANRPLEKLQEMKVREDLCILVATCESYQVVARWTISRIQKSWNPRPPIFLCGGTGADSIPFEGNAADWMAVTASAVRKIQADGFRWVYLILDDHPPVGKCHAGHLNETLPRFAEVLDSSNIALLGRRPRGEINGDDCGEEFLHLEHTATRSKWKFSVHPSLWSVQRLLDFLDARMAFFTEPGTRSLWNFERVGSAKDGPIPAVFDRSSYRVHGASMVQNRATHFIRQAQTGLVKLIHFLLRKTLGKSASDRFDYFFLGFLHFYSGPYPCLWSGAVHRGHVSVKTRTFLQWTGQFAMRAELDCVSGEFEADLHSIARRRVQQGSSPS
jgi:hypothetical protein